MNQSRQKFEEARDPLGLGTLPWAEPTRDGWPAIQSALQQRERNRRRVRWLAAAAVLVLTITTVLNVPRPDEISPAATGTAEVVQTPANDSEELDSLIALSQSLEARVGTLKERTGSVPANSAVYIAELQDLVAQVDAELSYSPDSVNLWAQRVNLLLDLAVIYQHQWELDYGKMASL